MLLDKLWVRIRGQLLTLKEDIFEHEELRQKAEDFLGKLERKLEPTNSSTDSKLNFPQRLDEVQKKLERAVSDARRASKVSSVREVQNSSTLEELETAWDELMTLRKEKKPQPTPSENEDAPPKPRRTLG